jgi:hypothetical protein
MWTYLQSTAAFRELPPDQLAFWQNLYQVYTQWLSFETMPLLFPCQPKSPLAWFHASMLLNDYYYGSPHNFLPYWVPGDELWSIYPDTPAGDLIMMTPITDQFRAANFFEYDFVRTKYNVRKSYWTGAPRQRRNL